MKIKKEHFGETVDGIVKKYTIENESGFSVSCLNYGCIITEILAPDRDGKLENVVLGFDNIEDYEQHSPYFGAVVGRVAGRIGGAEFELNGKSYHLAKNEGENQLHGGKKGFSDVIWNAEELADGIRFSYFSADGEEGYPGNLNITVTYTVTDGNELVIRYEAESDADTLLNVTNHSYFNLSGSAKRDILDHEIKIASDRFAELDRSLLPTGNMLDVTGTSFDFREGRKIRSALSSDHPQHAIAGRGYDHPFLLNKEREVEISVSDHESGRMLEIETDEPGVVLYTSNQLEDDFLLQQGVQSRPFLGICLETQGLPDAIHHPHFPSFMLPAGRKFLSVTKYSFGITN